MSDKPTTAATTFVAKYGEYTIDFDALPIESKRALITRGLAHILGNEASAKVATVFRQQAVAALPADATAEAKAKARADAIPDSESPEYVKVKADAQAELFKALLEGTIGAGRAPAAVVDPVEAEVAKLCTAGVLDILRGQSMHKGSKIPADDTTYTFGEQVVTFADLKARWLARNGERATADAKVIVKAREKAKANATGEGNALEALLG